MTKSSPDSASSPTSRRDFLKKSTLFTAGAAVAGNLTLARTVHAGGSDLIKIALVGCGGRGGGAAVNALRNVSHPNIKLWAMADAFADRIEGSLQGITEAVEAKEKIDVPPERRFTGLDAFENVMQSDVDVVLLCTPPGFRPMQFDAAVKAGKHAFMEKPVATDVPGVRRIMAASEEAKKKGLAIAVGHHLRHEKKHYEVIRRVHEGAIGDLKFLRVFYDSDGVGIRPRQPGETELQSQLRNWYYFVWLGGDHIVEQHVHDIDVGNWFAQGHPVEAEGMGGRQVRVGPDVGEIFDHHAVEFTYANGLKMFSYCRHIPNCWESFSQHAHGTKGTVDIEGHGTSVLKIDGQQPLKFRREHDGHQIEMDDLFAAIQSDTPYNEAGWAADSTMTAILGRIATYSGKAVRWDDALQSGLTLMPPSVSWDTVPPTKPGPDGLYACAVPGVTKAW
jgi:myo-inositol 2-dehydrogenase / D-chiro-inositol 1-dehydrogenase